GINANGLVVGESDTHQGDADQHAFVYSHATGMLDLNSLIAPGSGWDLNEATAINRLGQITGLGTFGGQERAFLLTPVPEPSAIVLTVIGATALGLLRIRKRRQHSN